MLLLGSCEELLFSLSDSGLFLLPGSCTVNQVFCFLWSISAQAFCCFCCSWTIGVASRSLVTVSRWGGKVSLARSGREASGSAKALALFTLPLFVVGPVLVKAIQGWWFHTKLNTAMESDTGLNLYYFQRCVGKCPHPCTSASGYIVQITLPRICTYCYADFLPMHSAFSFRHVSVFTTHGVMQDAAFSPHA